MYFFLYIKKNIGIGSVTKDRSEENVAIYMAVSS